jgi:hypothetical protein
MWGTVITQAQTQQRSGHARARIDAFARPGARAAALFGLQPAHRGPYVYWVWFFVRFSE